MRIADTIEDFINAGIADGKAPRTIKDYRRALLPFSEWCERSQIVSLADLTRRSVRAYSKYLREEKEWAESTWAIHIRVIRAFLRWIFLEGFVAENLSQTIKAPKPTMRVETLPSDEETKHLLQNINGKGMLDRRDRAILLTFLDTGIRVGELVFLTIDKWTKENQRSELLIFAPKTKRQRYVFLGRRATKEIESYLAAREKKYGTLRPDNFLFIGKGNKPLTTSGVRKMLNRRAEQAGLDPHKWHPHLFRKIFATKWLDLGGGDSNLQRLAGWQSPAMIKVYAKLSLNHIRTVHERIGLVDRLFAE